MKHKRMTASYFRKAMLRYMEICYERGYHPRYVGTAMRDWEDIFEGFEQ